MFTRCAVFEGKIHAGREEEFFRVVEERLLPLWRQMPHARAVRVLRAVRPDGDAPPIAMMQEIDYPSLAAIDEALASPIRTKARAETDELMKMFEGRFYHVVYRRAEAA
ncbi:hypothetical protein QNA08_18050 [Chelatococcus sp. SYSU_G07232]|uniref:Ethyl tert-butyl ether degradation protein EthD n=1 Tax=Chelatococcus albus TaxID=3047466 RepID=A0ABT7AL78_9HYPH|nr:hypothetical protein [Chelatococcus sp. SYSU_G07232]MDJ1160118.1 hypothetical protein [Chelatococcus sp. SYSU_G07232]